MCKARKGKTLSVLQPFRLPLLLLNEKSNNLNDKNSLLLLLLNDSNDLLRPWPRPVSSASCCELKYPKVFWVPVLWYLKYQCEINTPSTQDTSCHSLLLLEHHPSTSPSTSVISCNRRLLEDVYTNRTPALNIYRLCTAASTQAAAQPYAFPLAISSSTSCTPIFYCPHLRGQTRPTLEGSPGRAPLLPVSREAFAPLCGMCNVKCAMCEMQM